MKLEEFLKLELRARAQSGETLNLDALTRVQGIMKAYISPPKPREKPCEKCSAREVYADSMDVGGVNVQYEYWRVCLNCLDAEVTNDGTAEQWELWMAGCGRGSDANPFL